MNVQFRSGISGEAIERAIQRIETRIRADFPDIHYIYLEVGSLRTRNPIAEPFLSPNR